MRKLERLIKKELENFPGWHWGGNRKRSTHYYVTNGTHSVCLACSPKQNQTVLKNLRLQIRRCEAGYYDK